MELLELPHKVARLKTLDQEIFALQTLITFELSKEATPANAKCFAQSGQVFLSVRPERIRQEKEIELNQLTQERLTLREQVEKLQVLLEKEKKKASQQ